MLLSDQVLKLLELEHSLFAESNSRVLGAIPIQDDGYSAYLNDGYVKISTIIHY